MKDNIARLSDASQQEKTGMSRIENGRFRKGVSGNPGGRPRLPAEMPEIFQAKAPEAFEVLCKHLHASDPRVSVAATTQIFDRDGRPVQTVDANITENEPIRFIEIPRRSETHSNMAQ